MRGRRAQIALAAVALLLGFFVVVQYRSQSGGSELANRSAQELTVLVGNLEARNDSLRAQAATLERELAELRQDQAQGVGATTKIAEDMTRVRAWAGLDAVEGQGVLVTVAGPISGQSVQDLINELWSAGAEAIAVEDVRLVSGVVIAGQPGALSVENRILTEPFELRAIGRAETLTGTLTRIGGILAQLAATSPEASVTVTPVERLLVPATDRDMTPAHGIPTL